MISTSTIRGSGVIPPASAMGMAPGEDQGSNDPRRGARHAQAREDARRILVDFREADHDRRRPEFRRRRPARTALKDR
jgi:hypothetical protein